MLYLKMKRRTLTLLLLLSFSLGLASSRFFFPYGKKETTSTVVAKQAQKKQQVRKNVVTKVTTNKDGSSTTVVVDRSEIDKSTDLKSVDKKVSEKITLLPKYSIGVGATYVGLDLARPTYFMQAGTRFLGPLWLNVQVGVSHGLTPTWGVFLSWQF